MTKVKNVPQFRFDTNSNLKSVFIAFALFTLHFSLFTFSAFAQTDEPKDAAAPPLKMISKSEKNQLEAATDLKRRTTLAIALMDARLKKAEELNAQSSYEEMFDELGGFHALVEYTLNFLNRSDNGSRAVFQNYKRVEMSLRTYLSRLEVVRRELPLKYEFYVRGLVKVVRDARTKAVEPLFDTSVVPN